MFHSDTTVLEDFLGTLNPTTDPEKKARDAIITDVNLINSLRSVPSNEAKIDQAMGRISRNLEKLVGAGRWGTEAQPLPLNYAKHAASNINYYKTICLGPKTDAIVPQSELKDAFGEDFTTKGEPKQKRKKIINHLNASDTNEWESRNYEIKRYSPKSRATVPGGSREIGLTAEYAIEVGKKFQLKPGETKGGGKINGLLKQYGFDPGTEMTDGDHVLEMQLGGPNELENLWPLDSTLNQDAGGENSRAEMPKPDGTIIKMSDAKDAAHTRPVWLFIARTL